MIKNYYIVITLLLFVIYSQQSIWADNNLVTLLERPAGMDDLTMTGRPDHSWWARRSAPVSARPFAVYRLSVEVKTQHTAGTVQIRVRQIRSGGQCISYAVIASLAPAILDYTTYSNIFIANEHASELQAYYILQNVEGTASFRNLVLEKVTGAKARAVLRELAVPAVYFSLPAYVYSDQTRIDWGYRVNTPINPEAELVKRIVFTSPAHDFTLEIIPETTRQVVEQAALQFAEGVYELTARALDANGNIVTEETRELRSFQRPARRHQLPVREVRIDDSNNLLVNLRPVLPLGLYHIWRRADMVRIRDQGFNLIEAWQPWTGERGIDEFRQYMDWAAEIGLMARTVTKSHGLDDAELKFLVNSFKDHPAHLAWDLADEPNIRNIFPETLRAKADMIREIDPARPIIISFSGATDAHNYADCLDIVAAHTYPLPWGEITRVSEMMNILERDFGETKPRHATLQAWMNPNDPRRREHSPEEIRAMAYLAIINGARGISFYSFQSGTWRIVDYPRLWSVFKALTWELESLTEVILTGKRIEQVAVSAPEIEFLAMEYNGDRYIMAVNTSRQEVGAEFSLADWPQFTLEPLFRFGEVASAKPVNRDFSLNFSPLQSVVLKLVE